MTQLTTYDSSQAAPLTDEEAALIYQSLTPMQRRYVDTLRHALSATTKRLSEADRWWRTYRDDLDLENQRPPWMKARP